MLTHVQRLRTGQEGQGLAEYGLILALVAIAVITALNTLAGGISGRLEDVGNKIAPTP